MKKLNNVISPRRLPTEVDGVVIKINLVWGQSPSWEANSHLVAQLIPRFFMEPKDLLPCSPQPTACPYCCHTD
jgi:hypothetical protein